MISHGEAQPFDFKFLFSKEMLTSFMWHQEKKKELKAQTTTSKIFS